MTSMCCLISVIVHDSLDWLTWLVCFRLPIPVRIRCNPDLRRRLVRIAAIRGQRAQWFRNGTIYPGRLPQTEAKVHIPAAREAPGRCEILALENGGRRECRYIQCTRSLVCE